jgi:hypothetical protein
VVRLDRKAPPVQSLAAQAVRPAPKVQPA